MSTANVKSGFKTSVQNAGNRVKTYGRNYKSDIGRAYDVGYARGWEDAHKIPKRVGARAAASIGFSHGLKNRPKSDKYTSKYKR